MVNCAQQTSAVNSEKCTVQMSEVRAAKSECTRLSGVPPDCPVLQEDKGLQRSTARNPNGLLTWQAPDNEQCHVRCTTGLFGVPSAATTRIVVVAINTPQPPPFKPSKFFSPSHSIQEQKPSLQHTIKRSNPLHASKSTQLLSDLREGV
jgi:hypothetical protein